MHAQPIVEFIYIFQQNVFACFNSILFHNTSRSKYFSSISIRHAVSLCMKTRTSHRERKKCKHFKATSIHFWCILMTHLNLISLTDFSLLALCEDGYSNSSRRHWNVSKATGSNKPAGQTRWIVCASRVRSNALLCFMDSVGQLARHYANPSLKRENTLESYRRKPSCLISDAAALKV